jgi:hypothetical protein
MTTTDTIFGLCNAAILLAGITKRPQMNNLPYSLKFTDDLEREMILREIDFHEHDEQEGVADRVLKPLLLISVAIGVPLVTSLLH